MHSFLFGLGMVIHILRYHFFLLLNQLNKHICIKYNTEWSISANFSLAVAVLNWQYVNKHPCPVMIEDMGRTSDGTEIKSMYPLCNCNVPHVRKIREITDSDISSESNKPKTPEEEFSDHSSGEPPEPAHIIDSLEEMDMKLSIPDRELSDDYLIPFEKSESKGKNKREKKPIAAELRLRDDMNETMLSNKIHIMSSPEALIQEPSAGFHNRFNHDVESNKVPTHLIEEESVIDPPILLTDGSESDNILKYPEYEQVDKHYVPDHHPTTSTEVDSSDYEVQTSGSIADDVSHITDDFTSGTSVITENTAVVDNTNYNLETSTLIEDTDKETTTSTVINGKDANVNITANIYYELSTVSTFSTEKVATTVNERGSRMNEDAEVVSESASTISVETETSFVSTMTDDLDYGKFVYKNNLHAWYLCLQLYSKNCISTLLVFYCLLIFLNANLLLPS